eukprot:gene11114-7906_t
MMGSDQTKTVNDLLTELQQALIFLTLEDIGLQHSKQRKRATVGAEEWTEAARAISAAGTVAAVAVPTADDDDNLPASAICTMEEVSRLTSAYEESLRQIKDLKTHVQALEGKIERMRRRFQELPEARAAHVSFKVDSPEGIKDILQFTAQKIIAPGLMHVAREEFRQPHASSLQLFHVN